MDKKQLARQGIFFIDIIVLGYLIYYYQDRPITASGWVIIAETVFLLVVLIIIPYKRTIYSIDANGIFISTRGLMKWDDILSIRKKKRKTRNENEEDVTEYFIQLRMAPKPVVITAEDFTMTNETFEKTLRSFRDYNITEIGYDDDWIGYVN